MERLYRLFGIRDHHKKTTLQPKQVRVEPKHTLQAHLHDNELHNEIVHNTATQNMSSIYGSKNRQNSFDLGNISGNNMRQIIAEKDERRQPRISVASPKREQIQYLQNRYS